MRKGRGRGKTLSTSRLSQPLHSNLASSNAGKPYLQLEVRSPPQPEPRLLKELLFLALFFYLAGIFTKKF